jgi:hypothetical protein
MGSEFEMSMMNELILFLGLKITKYAKELVKKFDLDDCKTSKTPMTIDANLDVDEGGKSIDIH